MSTGLKETIQNRATNQSASWSIILAITIPAITYLIDNKFCVSDDSITSLLWAFGMVTMLLLFITNDKKQEHSNAESNLTNPKILEQNLLRQASIMEGYVSAFRNAVKELHPLLEKVNDISEPTYNTTGD